MFITYGTGFYGKVSTVNNQWIETKFFHIMFVPLFPLGSMFVTDSKWRKRGGFDISSHKKSIIATYMRLLTAALAILMFFLAIEATGRYYVDYESVLILSAVGLLSAAAWVYFCFFYGKATADDLNMRNKVGNLTGYYALPHWFDYGYQNTLLKNYEAIFKEKYPEEDWKMALKNNPRDAEKINLLFALALFNCMVNDLPENDELYAKADELFEKQHQPIPTPMLTV